MRWDGNLKNWWRWWELNPLPLAFVFHFTHASPVDCLTSDATALAALSRIFAREAALKVGEEGLRYVIGAGAVNDSEIPALETSLGLPAIHRAQAGLIADMDYIADVLYGRAAKRELAAA